MAANHKKSSAEDVTTSRRSLRLRSSASDASNASLLSSNTEMEVPKRKSWYKKIPRHSTNMRDVFGDNFGVSENFDIQNILQPADEADNSSASSVQKPTDLPDGISESSDCETLGSIHRSKHRLFASKPDKIVPKVSNVPIKTQNPETTAHADTMSESSTNESLGSIRNPQRKLFNHRSIVQPKYFQVSKRESLQKNNEHNITPQEFRKKKKDLFVKKVQESNVFPITTSNSNVASKTADGSIFVNTEKKTLFAKKKAKPNSVAFPVSVTNATNATIVANVTGKTADASTVITTGKRGLFAKKNVETAAFAVSLISESDEESTLAQQKLLFLKKHPPPNFTCRTSVASRSSKRAHSPDCTEFTEIDAWKLLPSSTMVADEMLVTSTPAKRPRRDITTIDLSIIHKELHKSVKSADKEVQQVHTSNKNKSKNHDQNKVTSVVGNKSNCSQITQVNGETPTTHTKPNGMELDEKVENEAYNKQSKNRDKTTYRGHGENHLSDFEARMKEKGGLEKHENYAEKIQEVNEEEGSRDAEVTKDNNRDENKYLLENVQASMSENNKECSPQSEHGDNQDYENEDKQDGLLGDNAKESVLRSQIEGEEEGDSEKEFEDDGEKAAQEENEELEEEQHVSENDRNESDTHIGVVEKENDTEINGNDTDEFSDENKQDDHDVSHEKSSINDNISKNEQENDSGENEVEMEKIEFSLVSESEDEHQQSKNKTSKTNVVREIPEERGDAHEESDENENSARKTSTANGPIIEKKQLVNHQSTQKEYIDISHHDDIQYEESRSKNGARELLDERNERELQENQEEYVSQCERYDSRMQKNESQHVKRNSNTQIETNKNQDERNESQIEGDEEDQSPDDKNESELQEDEQRESEMEEEEEQNESEMLEENEQTESEVQEDGQNGSELEGEDHNESEMQEVEQNESEMQEEQNESEMQEEQQNESEMQEEQQNESEMQEEQQNESEIPEVEQNEIEMQDEQNESEMQEVEQNESHVQEDGQNDSEDQEDEQNDSVVQEQNEEDGNQEEVNSSTEQSRTQFEYSKVRVDDGNYSACDDNSNETNDSAGYINKDASRASRKDRIRNSSSVTDTSHSKVRHNHSRITKNNQSSGESRRLTRSFNMSRTIDPARLEGGSRASVEFSKNISDPRSSSEGSGWNSHTTAYIQRKSMMNMTDARKSLRSMVLNKQSMVRNSNKPVNITKNVNVTVDFNEENDENHDYEYARPSVPTRVTFANITPVDNTTIGNTTAETSVDSPYTVQTKLNSYFNKITKEHLQKQEEIKEKVKKSIKKPESNPNFEGSYFETRKRDSAQQEMAKAKKVFKQNNKNRLDVMLNGAVYRPPKLYKPPKAGWITPNLYKFLDLKLRPRYGNSTRTESELFVQLLYEIYKHCLKRTTDVRSSIHTLKRKMASMGLVSTHWDFYVFLREFMPKEFRIKTIPDIVNGLPMPADPFAPIINPAY